MSIFQSNLRKQIRNLPKILNFVKIIHYFSKLFTSLLSCGRPRRRGSRRPRGPGFKKLSLVFFLRLLDPLQKKIYSVPADVGAGTAEKRPPEGRSRKKRRPAAARAGRPRPGTLRDERQRCAARSLRFANLQNYFLKFKLAKLLKIFEKNTKF